MKSWKSKNLILACGAITLAFGTSDNAFAQRTNRPAPSAPKPAPVAVPRSSGNSSWGSGSSGTRTGNSGSSSTRSTGSWWGGTTSTTTAQPPRARTQSPSTSPAPVNVQPRVNRGNDGVYRGGNSVTTQNAGTAGTSTPIRPRQGSNLGNNPTATTGSGYSPAPGRTQPQGRASRDLTRPQPNYPRTPNANGGFTEDRGSHKVEFNAQGRRTKVISGNKITTFRADGSKAQVQRGNTVMNFRRDGSREVFKNGQRQYSERAFRNDNGGYTRQRTVYRGNTTIINNYHSYRYGGRSYYAYAWHPTWFDVGFYGYCYHPWYTPIVYTWGWGPWYGYYGYYYHPYPAYYGPSYWLTDYVVADLLMNHYNNDVANANARASRAEADAAAARNEATNAENQVADLQNQINQIRQERDAPITDEVKTQLRSQIETTVKLHESQKPLQLSAVVQDLKHVYAVSDDLDVSVEGTDKTCSLTEGDLIRLTQTPSESDASAHMVVVTAKKGSCPVGSNIDVSISTLQDFLNDFSEKVEGGMKKMKDEKDAGRLK